MTADSKSSSFPYVANSPSGGDSGKLILEKCGYTVGITIGVGTFSKVMTAFSKRYEKTVALKIIQKKKSSKLFLEHFLPREIELVKGLHHPNILEYYQCIDTNHRTIISMEYVDNGTLLSLLEIKLKLNETDARYYFRQLIDAVKYCHGKHIAHRDLKLENLLLTKSNCVKVADFGFARKFKKNSDNPELSSTYCGSNSYACPEILKELPYDPMMADIWAIGVILYAMVIGFLPFEDTGSISKLIKIDQGIPFPPEEEISVSCKDLIKLLMAPTTKRLNVIKTINQPWVASK